MKFRFTDGWQLGDLCSVVSVSKDTKLADGDKKPFIWLQPTDDELTVTLDLDEGDCAFVYCDNDGDYSVSIKNVADDASPVELAIGGLAFVAASKTADKSVILTVSVS